MRTRTHLRICSVLAIAVGLVMVVMAVSEAQDGADGALPKATKKNKYIGSRKCKNCHGTESSGNQYKAWGEMDHRKAFDTLATDEAKEFGKKVGIENPQESPKCLKCHVTGHGEAKEFFAKSFKVEDGVQCESCHGPGQKHFKTRFAAAADEEEDEGFGDDEANEYQPLPAGELVTRPEPTVCLTCHNEESPSFKAFCFREKVKAIRHLDPRKKRDAKEMEAFKCGCGEKCECKKAECGGWPDVENKN